MNSLLVNYLISKGIQLKQEIYFISENDIKSLQEKLEPIISGATYSKGIFTSKIAVGLNKLKHHIELHFNNKDIIPLHLIKDEILNEPKLNIHYNIMYFVNEKNQIILLNYEPTE